MLTLVALVLIQHSIVKLALPISVIFDPKSTKSFVPSKLSAFTVKSAVIVATAGVSLANENAPLLFDVGIVSANGASPYDFGAGTVNAPIVGAGNDDALLTSAIPLLLTPSPPYNVNTVPPIVAVVSFVYVLFVSRL